MPTGLVPTRMGMILFMFRAGMFGDTCPHTHGDDPGAINSIDGDVNLSPHAWG